MEWKNQGGLVVCNMSAEELGSLRDTLVDARDTTLPFSHQNFPADYAELLLDSMTGMAKIPGWEPWTPEEEASLEEAWRLGTRPLPAGFPAAPEGRGAPPSVGGAYRQGSGVAPGQAGAGEGAATQRALRPGIGIPQQPS